MTKIVILAATEHEIAPCLTIPDVRFAVTGMGATHTAISTIKAIETHRPDVIIQIGIAGAFDRSLALCQPVMVGSDRQSDLGAWRGDSFEDFEPHTMLHPTATPGPGCIFATVTSQSTNTACSPLTTALAQIETMEGAAFFEAAIDFGIPCLQLRTISNYVTQPRAQWKILEAIQALRPALDELLAQEFIFHK